MKFNFAEKPGAIIGGIFTVVLLAALLIILKQNYYLSRLMQSEFGLKEGDKIPNKTIVTMSDDTLQLFSAEYNIILFFNGYCESCKKALPLWQQVFAKNIELMPKEKLQILGVSEENFLATLSIISELGLSFPIVIDTRRELEKAFKVRYKPAAFLVSRSGKLLYRQKFMESSKSAIRNTVGSIPMLSQ